ncbi:MAG TPA: hypothetical protein DEH78_19330 [Solibacterales bacterium]|nr:hypothetical protein [Bryobacterales bacterium]
MALLVGEPHGRFGFFNPTGHASIYLDRLCAATPTSLRWCAPGEPGVVISRYNRIGGFDWLAVPLGPYFYAIEVPHALPSSISPAAVFRLRDEYRRRHLRDIAPDGPGGEPPKGDWTQLVGTSFDRTVWGYYLETTREDDERLLNLLNGVENRRRFNLFARNCADFAKLVINHYFPKALRRSIVADAGITTPKHLAGSLVKFARSREIPVTRFVIAQVAGVRRSTKTRGVAESLVRSKKYAVPLLVFQPWIAGGAAVAYLTQGRYDPRRGEPIPCPGANLPYCLTPPETSVADAPQ